MTQWTAPTGMVQSGAGWWYPENNASKTFADEAGYNYSYIGDPNAAAASRAAGRQLYTQTSPGVFGVLNGNPPPMTPIFQRNPGGGPQPGQPGSPTQGQSASGMVDEFLSNYGLQGLGAQILGWRKQGASDPEIILKIRETAEYAARFPAMAALRKNRVGFSEGDYVHYERSIREQNQAAGLTDDWNDPQDIQKLLESNVSPAEYQARLQARQTAVWQSPPEVRQALQDYYGISAGQLTAFWIDPDRALPLIQRDLAAAQAGGSAQRTGFGQIDRDYAEHLADLGLTQQQLDVGFNKVAGMGQITQGLPGQQPGIGTTTALQAQFDQNAQAQAQVEAAQADILNQFRRGGQPAATNRGVLGAGSTG